MPLASDLVAVFNQVPFFPPGKAVSARVLGALDSGETQVLQALLVLVIVCHHSMATGGCRLGVLLLLHISCCLLAWRSKGAPSATEALRDPTCDKPCFLSLVFLKHIGRKEDAHSDTCSRTEIKALE